MNWKRTLWILWGANFFVTAGMNLVIPFLPLYVETLGVHSLPAVERWSGWIFSVQFITSFLFQPIWGAVADRRGRKIMLLRAGFGMGAVTALMGFVFTPWQLLVLRLLNGVFSGFISMAASLQASVTPDEYGGRALGTLQTGAIAGSLIGPLMGGALVEAIGYRGVFVATGVLLCVASLIVMFFVHEDPSARKQKGEQMRGNWKKMGILLPVFIASTVTQVGVMSIEPIVTIYAKTLYSGPHIAFIAGLVVATTGVANLVGAPTIGRLGDRFGQRRVLIVALAMAAVSYLPQALARNIPELLVGRFMLGWFIGGMIPSLNVLVKKLAPPNLLATAFGFNSASLFLGNLIGPLIGSTVAAGFGIRNVFYVTMAFLLVNAVSLLFNRSMDLPRDA